MRMAQQICCATAALCYALVVGWMGGVSMNCYDRDQESDRLWRYFENGKNVLMLAPRRIGKTILLNRLKEESESKGFHAVLLDVQGYREEKAFFSQLCASIQEEVGIGQAVISALTDRLRRLFHGAESQRDWRTILLATDWTEFADHLLSQLEETQEGEANHRWLVLVDEIAVFTKALLDAEGKQKAHDFLYKLRNLRQKHRNVLWLYTGSIGLDAIARRNDIEGALVDMEIVPLEPFARETAIGFLNNIAQRRGCSFTAEALDIVLSRLGWFSPYYLEKIAEVACDKTNEGREIGPPVADHAANSLLDLTYRTYWATWREHLDKNFTEPDRTHLFALLAAIAQSPDGASVGTLLQILNTGDNPRTSATLNGFLDTLECDGYLSADPARTRFRFRMNLLREWWLRYVAV
jgi:AAA+ ATPase superfamily predicted ATPase